MSFLPLNTDLGVLTILEIYEYYDIPCLFSCVNERKEIFLAVWVEQDSSNGVWLYVKMSLERNNSLNSGLIDLRDSFLQSESRDVYKVTIPCDEQDSTIEAISADSLPDKWLPLSGEYVAFSTQADSIVAIPNRLPELAPTSSQSKETSEFPGATTSFAEASKPIGNGLTYIATPNNSLASIKKPSTLTSIAKETGREIISLNFTFPIVNLQEAPIRSIGNILFSLQPLVDAIVQLKRDIKKFSKLSPKESNDFSGLSVMKVSYGSFIVQLGSATNSPKNIFGLSAAGEAVSEIIELMIIGADETKLCTQLKLLKFKTAQKYRDFLISLVDSGTDTIIEWSSPDSEQDKSVYFSNETAQLAYSIVSDLNFSSGKSFVVTGELVGVNKRTKKFEIWDIENNKYTGSILESAMSYAATATLSKYYRATIREVRKISAIVDEEKVKYELVSLKLLEDNESLVLIPFPE